MKKIIFLLFLLINITGLSQTTYYVGSTGNDATGDGSVGSPWKTLGKACRTVTTSGDIIYVNAGTITADRDTLSVGVNITGAGATSIIQGPTENWILYAVSAVEGTNGNQSISNVKFLGYNGSDTSTVAIYVTARSNVSIHDCHFQTFKQGGVRFKGSLVSNTAPTIYSTGNRFYNNVLTDCSGYYGTNGYGSLAIGGQQDIDIYNNSITQIAKGTQNGYLIKYIDNGHNKDVKIYDNYLTRKVNNVSGHYEIAIELWNSKGGIEIYDNNIYGGTIDFGGDSTQIGAYTYAAYVHDNTLQFSVTDTLNNTEDERLGISIEANASDIEVSNNYIKNYPSAIGFSARKYPTTAKRKIHRIDVHNNIIHNYGNTYSATGSAVNVRAYSPTDTIRDIYFYNNVIYDDEVGYDPRYAFWFQPDSGHIDNFRVINNIIQNTGSYWMRSQIYQANSTATIDSVLIQNNILHSNVADTLFSIDANVIHSGNLTDNPLFISEGSNFRLQSGSPARNAGLDVGLTLDYDGNIIPYEGIPDIGAFEYVTLPVPVTGLGWDDILFHNNFKGKINIANTWMINGEPVTATAAELNSLTPGAGGATTGLDNLSSVAINTHLLPATDGAVNLGSATYKWGNIFMDSAKYISWNNAETITHSDGTLTVGADLALGSNNLTLTGSISTPATIAASGLVSTGAIRVGTSEVGSNVDSVKISGTTIGFYDGATQLSYDFPASDEGELGTYSMLKTDTVGDPTNVDLLYTARQVDSIMSAFNGFAASRLEFIVDTTADAPITGDSILIHTSFIDKHIEIGRGTNGGTLYTQYRKPVGQTYHNGYSFQKATGRIVFTPHFETNEHVIIEATDSTSWTTLTPQLDYEAEYDAVLAEMTNDPQGDTLRWQNDMVKSLVDAGYLARMDLFYLFATNRNTANEALINWANPGTFNADNVHATAWLKNSGYIGDGANDWISTNWTIADTSHYKMNSASVGFVISTNTTDKYIYSFGSTSYCAPRDGYNDFFARMHSNGPLEHTNNTTSVGSYIVTRRDHLVCEVYKNGANFIDLSEESTTAGSGEMNILRRYIGDGYSSDRISVFFVMDGVTDGEASAINTIIEHYLDHVGAGVQ